MTQHHENVTASCDRALALLRTVEAYNGTDTEMSAIHGRAWAAYRAAVAMPATTPEDVRAQVALISAHHRVNDSTEGLDTVLRRVLAVLPPA